MSDVKTTYSVSVETERSTDILEITKMNETVHLNIRHTTQYDGRKEVTYESIALPMETFSELINEIWKGI